MHRKQFLQTSMLMGLGSSFILKQEFLKIFTNQNIEIESLLGLNTSHLLSDSILLEDKAYHSFQKMKAAAATDGVELHIVSGYRSYQQQKAIWERKFNQLTLSKSPADAISEIITYSSVPGTSRHHWGTDIDLIDTSVKAPEGDLLLEKNYHQGGPYHNLKTWMDRNAQQFGFHLVYTDDEERTGFNYEPWHYSFAPSSIAYLAYQNHQNYMEAWNKLSFKGKSDMSDVFIRSYFKNYSLGINPTLMPS